MTKKFNFRKKKFLNQQTIEIKQLKEVATTKDSYSSSQPAEIHPMLRASRDHAPLQP